jgi:glycosyltransferase involved in cell wall biosynthesis
MEGYNVLIPSVCRQNSPEIILPVMDALQALNHTPVVMDMVSIVEMYRDMRYRRHGCYELFQFYLRDLFKKYKVDFAFSTGLGVVMEDSQKREAHHLAEECGIPTIILLHVRDYSITERLLEIGAAKWNHTFIACTSQQLNQHLRSAGIQRTAHMLPGTNYRVFYPADAVPDRPAFPLKLEDKWLADGFEVSFAGRWTPGRDLLLSALDTAGIQLAIYGDEPWGQSQNLAKHWRNAVPALEGLNTIYNASKIVLDLPHDSTELDDFFSQRLLDGLASRAFVITHRRPALISVLEPERDVATFGDSDELVRLVRYFLDHDAERQRVANRGYWRVRHEASWEQRLSSVLPQLEMHVLATSAA